MNGRPGRLLILLVLLFLTVPLTAGAAEKFGRVFDIKGDVELSSGGKTLKLMKEKHILQTVFDGDRIKTGKDSGVLIVSLKDKKGYEVPANTTALIKEGAVRPLTKGARIKTNERHVNVREGAGSGDAPGAYVLLSTGPCVQLISPVDTAVLDLTPELRWSNDCGRSGKLSASIQLGDKVVFSGESDSGSVKVPPGVLGYGKKYRLVLKWSEIGDVAANDFWISAEESVKQIKATINYYEQNKGDLPTRLSYVFYLLDNNLRDHARVEIERLNKEFPGNDNIESLMAQ